MTKKIIGYLINRGFMIVKCFNRIDFNLQDTIAVTELGYEAKINDVLDGCVCLTDSGVALNWVSDWLNQGMAQSIRNHNTSIEYGKILGYFLDFLIKREVRYKRKKPVTRDEHQYLFLDVNRNTIAEFINVHCKDLSKDQRSLRDVVLKQFYDEYICMEKHYRAPLLEFNPYENGRVFKPNRNTIFHGGVTPDELMALMIVAKDERERCLFQFLLDSGVRRSEIPKIKLMDIEKAISGNSRVELIDSEEIYKETDYCSLLIRGVKARNRSPTKDRYTKVSRTTLRRLKLFFDDRLGFYKKHTRALNESEKYAFLNSNGEPMLANNLDKLIARRVGFAKSIGLIGMSRKITSHKFRHGFSVLFLVSPDIYPDEVTRKVALSKCLGHSKVETTEIHYEDLPQELHYKKETGEVVGRCDLMANLYQKTKPSVINKTKAEYLRSQINE